MRIQDIPFLKDHPSLSDARIKPAWLYTTRRYPLYWHHVAKNGGTFFKNLLYALDHDAVLARSSDGHDWDEKLVRAVRTPKSRIRNSGHSIIIVRNPFRRFLSVYFNKVYDGGGPRPTGMSREFFDTHDIDQSPDLDAAGHTRNCMKLADWGARNVLGVTKSKPNWHLVPQMHQLAQVYDLNFRVLTLEDLEWQLQTVFAELIPDINAKIDLVQSRNRSRKSADFSAVMTPELKQRLKETYADDLRAFQHVRRHWREEKAKQPN